MRIKGSKSSRCVVSYEPCRSEGWREGEGGENNMEAAEKKMGRERERKE